MSRFTKLQAGLVRVGRFLLDVTGQTLRFAVRAVRGTWPRVVAFLRSDFLWNLVRPIFSVARIAAVAVAISAVTLAAIRSSVRTIQPTQIGVIQNGWGDGAGVQEEDLDPQKVVVIPGRDTLHLIDARTHYMRFGMESEGNEFPSLELRTPEDLEVRVGVTVPYRVKRGEAHQMVKDGIRGNYPTLARAAIERVLLDEFAAVGREQWSNSEARLAVEASATTKVAEALQPFHLEPLGVHVTATWLPPTFEAEIMEQKLLEQRILTDEMLARRDAKTHELKVEQEAQQQEFDARAAELNFAIDEARLAIEDEADTIRAESQRYEFDKVTESKNRFAKLVAEGQLALDQAGALRERLINEALESEGGKLLLARDAARALTVRSVKLDANNPSVPSFLDLDALSALLIGN